jgi:hypothetical protein
VNWQTTSCWNLTESKKDKVPENTERNNKLASHGRYDCFV